MAGEFYERSFLARITVRDLTCHSVFCAYEITNRHEYTNFLLTYSYFRIKFSALGGYA